MKKDNTKFDDKLFDEVGGLMEKMNPRMAPEIQEDYKKNPLRHMVQKYEELRQKGLGWKAPEQELSR